MCTGRGRRSQADLRPEARSSPNPAGSFARNAIASARAHASAPSRLGVPGGASGSRPPVPSPQRSSRLLALQQSARGRCSPLDQPPAAQIAALPDAIDAFVLLVHAGLTPQARRRTPRRRSAADDPTGIRRGRPPHPARREHSPTRSPRSTPTSAPVLLAFVDLVAASSRYGLPIADVLTQLSVETRATRRRLDEAAARALPVKLSFPLVLCTLPSFVLLAIAPAVLAALSSLGNNAW